MPAIIIGRYNLTETSYIIHWSCAEHGLIKTVAKSAAKPTSPFFGRLDLFVSAEIRFTRSRKSDLHTLTELQWSESRLGLRSSYARVLAATYLVRLVEMSIERETSVPVIHDLLTRALDYLATHEPSKALIERFELRLAEELGVHAPGARPAATLQMAVHQTLPVQRRQLFNHLDSAPPKAPKA
jgi:DNA repair protein RecO (recombination protein O)